MVNSNSMTAGPGRRIVLRDVAHAAGVSVMTVSRALRHGEQVSAPLRQKIRTLARELGYEPDPALAALAAYRHRTRPHEAKALLAYVTADATRDAFRQLAVTGQVFLGAEARGRELGYRVEPVWLPDLCKRHRHPTKVLLNRGIRGLIMARMPKVDLPLDLDWDKFSCVAMGHSLQKPALHYVASHLFQDMCLAFDRCLERGYRRPLLVLTEDANRRTLQQFHAAFLLRQQVLAAADRLPVLWLPDQQTTTALKLYLHQHEPDVLIAAWPELKSSLDRLRVRVPQDLGFVDLNLQSPHAELSGIFQNFPRLGRAAVDRLNMQLQLGERGVPAAPEGTTLYGLWVPGQTLPPKRG